MNSIDRELMVAAQENNVPEARRLLRAGADIEAKDIDDWTPLHRASCHGHVQVVIELREHGADIEARENHDMTPLHISTLKGHVAVVIELLGHGADSDASNTIGTTTSILCKRKSREGADINAKDRNGDTALHFASEIGHLAVTKALLSGGADVLAVNNQGELPIHYAVFLGNSAIAKCLLQQLYATTRRLPLHELVEDLTLIGDHYSIDAPLRSALRRNVLGPDDVVEILEYLVYQNNELISSLDRDGSLPLHVACRRGASFTIFQSLTNLYKASVKSVTPQGDLPLFLACEMPETSLDTIFILMKLYPDLVYR
jgi:ankyrin repeat protein